MAAQNSNAADATSLSQKLRKMIDGGKLDYNAWRALILEIETASPEDIDTISLAYDSVLSAFPLCHWHLEKYAQHKLKLCGAQEATKIYERGVALAMFSVGFWVDYFTFVAACSGDPEDVRRLFGRAISFVGKDYFCHVLWDKYIKYEFNQEGWSFLAQSYIQALRFPMKKLHFYYDNFKQFVGNLEEEIGYNKNPDVEVEISSDEISLVIKDLLESSDISFKSKALDRYRTIGEEFYQEACQMERKIKCFETNIQRQYFSVTPLDVDQLKNWHLYLDFIEKQDNLDSAVKLYERCLIPCANYPEFWMRYVEFLESKGGREMAISALNRATQIFLKNVREIHLFSARYKEHIGDADGARSALLLCDTNTDSGFIENVLTQANMERRLGNFAAATATYEKALKTASENQKLHILPTLYSHFARLTFLITGSADAARDVLINGLQNVPYCKFLLEEFIKFVMTHEGARQVQVVDSVIADAISPGLDEYECLDAKDREDISCLFLEFVNLCGTVQDVRKAWNRHVKLFPKFLRMKNSHKHPTSINHLLDVVRDKKRSYENAKVVVSSNENASRDDEVARVGPMVVSDDLANQSKEIALSTQSSEIEPGLIDQSKENTLSPFKSTQEVKNSPRTNSRLNLLYNQPELTLENISSNSRENDSREVIRENNTPPRIHADQEEPSRTREDSTQLDQLNPARHKRNHSDLDPIQEDKDKVQTPISYPQENTNQINSQQQYPWPAQQNITTNQMMQYYYQQQQYQQQYLQMQQHYMNQQAYQQHYAQQQSPYQQNVQLQQVQGPHEKQYSQSQEQLAAYQAQQLLMQQYQQQYQQGYQHLPHQQQFPEGYPQNTSQNQQGPKTAPPDYDGAAKRSVSPHLQDQSTPDLQ